MNLSLDEEQREFQEEAIAWMESHAPREPLPPPCDKDGFDAHCQWEKELAAAGYTGIDWPVQFGGRGRDLEALLIFEEVYWQFDPPERVNVNGLGFVGPAILMFGDEEQKQSWLPRIVTCDDIWCQGFSESDAGSDLGSIRTSAMPKGNDFILRGHKMWSTYGPFGDWLLVLARTDTNARASAGMSMLAVDMKDPSVDVRPIRQISGESEFAEVFLNDVEVPRSNVIGRVNDGWRVAMRTLEFERGTALGSPARLHRDLRHLRTLIDATGRAADDAIKEQFGTLYADVETFRYAIYRSISELSRGRDLGAHSSVNKILYSEVSARVFELGLSLMGHFADLDGSAPLVRDTFGPEVERIWTSWHRRYWLARASTIASGTNEIQRNVIARGLLRLPNR